MILIGDLIGDLMGNLIGDVMGDQLYFGLLQISLICDIIIRLKLTQKTDSEKRIKHKK